MEVYLASSGEHCSLPNMTGSPRYYHTMERLTVCGGSAYTETNKVCLSLTTAGWLTSSYLLDWRYFHSSWSSPSGLVLLGGEASPTTSERLQEGGNTTYSFPLHYDTV